MPMETYLYVNFIKKSATCNGDRRIWFGITLRQVHEAEATQSSFCGTEVRSAVVELPYENPTTVVNQSWTFYLNSDDYREPVS